ncbi:putative acyltransferase [Rivularia sp. PCC 7116]|uniref:GNAT family N-acetyltransferase n=1 Tax=Rivularia sp. PCC 7116 TaxID=373994 RepID=UPI00029ED1C5|nr:GNAT family N-acetyltransferase [Rivularia sp. PCC 7116]AFY54561.1 putative acyltransferase [Rivularia sp. PCC 7116]
MAAQNLNIFPHPRLDEIQHYTAIRLGCDIDNLKNSGSVILSAKPKAYEDFMEPSSLEEADIISLAQMDDCSIIRKNPQESEAVKKILEQVDCSKKLSPEDFLQFENVKQNGYEEPYFYLNPKDFQVFPDSNVIQLSKENPEHVAMVASLHETVEEKMRWFSEIDHPVVYGYMLDQKIVGIASHFLFESSEFKVAAGGVLVNPEYRRRNIGKAVVSKICEWALQRDYIIEWSSWDKNIASIALAKSLGFKQFLSEYEFSVS